MPTMDPKVPFLGGITPGDLVVDNPDGVVAPNGLGGGPYAVGSPKGRIDSQGASNLKGGLGNASGMGKTTTVK